jgi:amino-acid N-acetyltransferase
VLFLGGRDHEDEGMKTTVVLREAAISDRPAVEQLLAKLKLPVAGVGEWIRHFWIAEAAGDIVGVAGVELYGDGALLRSVAVHPDWRSGGLGRRLIDRALTEVKRAGVRDVFLLTTTAERYFPRLGFEDIPRGDVPPGVQTSIEFREACPASAVVMRKVLQ